MKIGSSVPFSKPVSIMIIVFGIGLGPLLLFFGTVELIRPEGAVARTPADIVACLTFILLGISLLAYAAGVFRCTFFKKRKDSSSTSGGGA